MKRRRMLQGLLLAPLAPKPAALPVPATPAPAVEWTTLTAAQKAAWGRSLFREAARARLGTWMATRIDELMLEHLSGQTGTTSLPPPDP